MLFKFVLLYIILHIYLILFIFVLKEGPYLIKDRGTRSGVKE